MTCSYCFHQTNMWLPLQWLQSAGPVINAQNAMTTCVPSFSVPGAETLQKLLSAGP